LFIAGFVAAGFVVTDERQTGQDDRRNGQRD
jgi:hypothetical protein